MACLCRKNAVAFARDVSSVYYCSSVGYSESATRTWHLSDSVMTLLSMAAQTARESCTGVLSSFLPQKALSNSVLCSIILAVNFPENVPSSLSFFASSSVSEAEWVASRLTKVTGTPELRAI